MKNLLAWVTTSSADPAKTAMTVKGFLTVIVPILVMVTGIDNDLANSLIGPLVDFATTALTIVGTLMTIFGIGRKIILGRFVHPLA